MTDEPTDSDDEARAGGALTEVITAFVAVTVVTWIVATFGRGSAVDAYVPLAIGALFGLVAIELAQRQAGGLSRYGLGLGGLLEPPTHPPTGLSATLADLAGALRRALPRGARETGFALAVAVVVFPPFVLGFRLWHDPSHAFELRFPEDPASYVLGQLVVIALPEEAFFRGYVQGRLADHFTSRNRVFGAALCPQALLVQALLFGIVHALVDLDPLRLSVFFPALLFGWLRERRGGIGAAAVFHMLSNLLSDVLVRGWL